MQKIIKDIEDYTIPEKKFELEKTEEEKTKIKNLLINLQKFCEEYSAYNNLAILRKDFTKFFNKECRLNKLNTKKTDLILEYRLQLENKNINKNVLLEKLLCKKPSRSISGISSITLVMSPYPNGQKFSCKHNCYYCPNEPAHKGNDYQAQPRSYLYHEPAVRRANHNKFQAYEQMIDRMDTLEMNGHVIDKLEIILEGGTYTEYPEEYLNDFNRDIYYSANTYFDTIPKREKLSLDEEVKINRNSTVHIIGICIETRPDAITDDWIIHFRQCGVTRIQLGVQTVHNHILKKINRGHNIECVIETMEYLRNLCFKIDIHLMPDLPFSTPELDKQIFDFTYSKLMPDQIKIYPCSIVPWTIIEKWYNEGKWEPYSPEILKDVLDYGMKKCPDWIRIPRVIRDIPNLYIQAGNQITNLRQMLSESRDIRSREIERHSEYYNKPAKIFVECYNNDKITGTSDYFISYESLDKVALFGFIRLRLPNKNKKFTTNGLFPILNKKALIRELHVYGYNTAVGADSKASQHKGIGTKLLKKAENIAYFNNYSGVVVISGEGVKNYYVKKGYSEKETYMIKYFYCKFYNLLEILLVGIITYYINFF
jgi:ELP3 family radical SAM enzyme/protein acetyltransferase